MSGGRERGQGRRKMRMEQAKTYSGACFGKVHELLNLSTDV